MLDQRTDLFSFGVVLYEMVTGTQPFVGQSTGEVLEAIFSKQPTAPVRLNPKIPAELERIIYKALEKDPNLRYQSAAEIRTDLQRLRRDSSVASSVASTPVEKDTAKVHSTKKTSKLWIGIAAAVAAIVSAWRFLVWPKTENVSTSRTDFNCCTALCQHESR